MKGMKMEKKVKINSLELLTYLIFFIGMFIFGFGIIVKFNITEIIICIILMLIAYFIVPEVIEYLQNQSKKLNKLHD